MFLTRPAEARGKGDFDWLKTRYTFSFAGHYDPHFMGFRSLRVLNQDEVAPGRGFPMHGHSDMEILTIVLSGKVEHKDSMGHLRSIAAGQVQCMTAGTGIQHSERNPSSTEPLHLLQIWIEPAELALTPSYQEADLQLLPNRWTLVAGPIGGPAPLKINQEAWLWQCALEAGNSLPLEQLVAEYQWLQVISGEVDLQADSGVRQLKAGDGIGISRESGLSLMTSSGARVLLFDPK